MLAVEILTPPPQPLPIAPRDQVKWDVAYRVDKFHEDMEDWRARVGTDYPDLAEAEAAFNRECSPWETIEGTDNLLLNAGISLMEDLLIGAGGTTFANANAYLGVGDSSTAAAASQTDLQASTNKLRVAMDATYPSRSGQTLTFRATFTSGNGNYAWQEWIIVNGSSGGTALNRKAESLGTKSGGSWQLTVTIVIS